MGKIILLILLTVSISCSTIKKTEHLLNNGDYDNAIVLAITRIKKNKLSSKSEKYIPLLEDAYEKAVNKDLERISFLEKDDNPENLEEIYEKYQQLKRRQNLLKPLLPLSPAKFKISNYDANILNYKSKLVEYLYKKAYVIVNREVSKNEIRTTYEDLEYLEKIQPNYKDTRSLLDQAHSKGVDRIILKIKNSSRTILPKDLEQDILYLDNSNINSLWKEYDVVKNPNVNYDLEVSVDLKSILISPERIIERQLQREKIVVDGWEYLKDDEGKIVRDLEGEKVKVDIKKKVICEYYEFKQLKSADINAKVSFVNLKTKQIVNTKQLASNFIFEHVYAEYNGDKRALEDDLIRFLGLQEQRFPTNDQMIFDASEHIKDQLKEILRQY